jgi:histidinol-phosphatase
MYDGSRWEFAGHRHADTKSASAIATRSTQFVRAGRVDRGCRFAVVAIERVVYNVLTAWSIPMPQPSLETLIEFALDAAWRAGRITLGYFQTGVTVERKADSTPLTIADREAEKSLRELAARYWPDHGIVGEEFGATPASSPYTWVFDPIDGTKSFVAGVPLYANLVALLEDDRPVLGVIHLPALGETVWAARGRGCHWNGRRVHVSDVDRLENALLLTSGLDLFGAKKPAWDRLVAATYVQRTWGDAYGYALVATGRAEIMIDPVMELWDAAPMQVILEEAGGHLTDWHGQATVHHRETVASNAMLHGAVMRTMRGEPAT